MCGALCRTLDGMRTRTERGVGGEHTGGACGRAMAYDPPVGSRLRVQSSVTTYRVTCTVFRENVVHSM